MNKRLTALEEEMSRLKGRIEKLTGAEIPWWKKIEGSFQNDPSYKKAMSLGRKYRESLRPKSPKRRKRSDGGT